MNPTMATATTAPEAGAPATTDRRRRALERASEACLACASALSGALGLAPVASASAAMDVSSTLTNVLNMLANGVVLLGGILVVMGLVSLGIALKDAANGGGGAQISGAVSMIVGGMVVVGAGAYFRTFDTNLSR